MNIIVQSCNGATWTDIAWFDDQEGAMEYIRRNRECTGDELRVVEVLYIDA